MSVTIFSSTNESTPRRVRWRGRRGTVHCSGRLAWLWRSFCLPSSRRFWVTAAASAAGYKKAVLAPFMVVAGDHANNDMADETDPDSWAAKFVAAGFEVTCLLQGLGQNVAVDDIYVSHVDDAIAKL